MDFKQLQDVQPALNSLGILGILALILITGFRRMWHTHGEFIDMQNIYLKQIADITADRNDWKEKAGKAIDTNEAQADQLGRLTSIVEALTPKAG